jgi:hypothetical protein
VERFPPIGAFTFANNISQPFRFKGLGDITFSDVTFANNIFLPNKYKYKFKFKS